MKEIWLIEEFYYVGKVVFLLVNELNVIWG